MGVEGLPRLCSFRGAREEVMERVWHKARKLEERGIAVTNEVFGLLIKNEWEKVKEEASKVCPVLSPAELQRVLEEIESGEKREQRANTERSPIEAKVAVSVKAQEKEE